MKTLALILLYPLCLCAQVGINTTIPQATLDIEGNIRIAQTNEGSDLAARDSILVIDGNQILRVVTSKKLLSNLQKSIVKGNLSAADGVSISSGETLIPFNTTELDIKNEFNTTTSEFVATDPGIYRVSAQIKQDVLTAGDFGLSIYKVNHSGTETLLTRERYLNLNVSLLTLNLNVSSPMRRVETITSLAAGERIRFKTNSAIGLSISGSNSDTFFIIEQIR